MSADAALVATGPFALLDVELTVRILTSPLLAMRERLQCVTCVCKGWRSLRRHPGMWQSLKLEAPLFSGDGMLAFVTGPRSLLPSPVRAVSCYARRRV